MNVFIPLEIKTRELESKLLVSFEAADNNFKVIIGRKDNIFKKLLYMEKGILLWSFGNVKNYEWIFKYIKNLGHKIATIDEEGLLFLNKEIYAKYRISLEALENVEICFAWGNIHKEAIIYKAPKSKDKIVLIGNPRFDLLRPEFRKYRIADVNSIKKKHSPFVLINTNFSFSNHYYGKDYFYSSLKKVCMIKESSDKEFWKNWIDYQEKIFNNFLEMIPKLSKKLKDHKIIIRPHHSENHEVWRDSMKDLDNVSINSEGNVISWIMASEAIIQNNCTTAVEAFILNIPGISYRPVTSDLYDCFLPNALSYNAFNFEELDTQLHDILSNGRNEIFEDESKKQVLDQYIFSDSSDLAKDKIVEALKGVKIKDIKILNKYLIYKNYYKIRKLGSKILHSVLKKEKAGSSYIKHKCPELKINEIKDFLIKTQKATGKYFNIIIKDINDSCFEITQDVNKAGI